MQERFEHIDRCVQLHEHVELHYHVDCFQAQLWTQDGDKCVMRMEGKTAFDALLQLDSRLSTWELSELRLKGEEE